MLWTLTIIFFVKKSQYKKMGQAVQSTISGEHVLGQGDCAICLQGITNPKVLQCCGHSFCGGCIRHWLSEIPTCPLCRSDVTLDSTYMTPSSGSKCVWSAFQTMLMFLVCLIGCCIMVVATCISAIVYNTIFQSLLAGLIICVDGLMST